MSVTGNAVTGKVGAASAPVPLIGRKLKINIGRLVLLAAFLGIWEFASGRLVAEFFVSKPSKIFAVLNEWLWSGTLAFHASITATEALTGFILGGFIGMIMGTILGRSQGLAELLEPFIMAFYSLPKVALAPLFVMWLGIGISMKITLTAAIVFFLVFLNTYTGVRSVSKELVTIMHLMGAKERHILLKVVIPSALSWVFAGLKVSVPYALIGAIVGELIASNRGLGYLLSSSAGQFDTAGVFAALAAVIALAALLNLFVKLLEVKMAPWKTVETQQEFTI
ncbi:MULTISPECIES: ABC transporter permease [Chelativorans]|jgi:NitT/TauT family transport system permease protein|uniref:Binding-protein-dependent transport systems inner membrane component n=1 Tax=Chelativorans sp. (strain BNC1) TaxID=266779 RepID=Q11E41_CHESB|nr:MULTISPECIES: ABC transporter permease [Chelativorans]